MRTSHQNAWRCLAVAVAWSISTIAAAQKSEDVFADYRAMLGDDNPASFVVEDGEALWKKARGPKNASLEKCDLGLGQGVVKGAYAQLPRYFADTDQVMDLAGRLIHCMVTLQGFSADEIKAKAYSSGSDQSDLEKLEAYVSSKSSGMAIHVPQEHPKEKAMFELGRQMFAFRAGPYDFGCSTCHRQTGKRIRLQAVPNLTLPEGAKSAYPFWPAYRISQGVVRTMDWRIADCVRQQRLPELQIASDISIGLQSYMAVLSNGADLNVPGLKR